MSDAIVSKNTEKLIKYIHSKYAFPKFRSNYLKKQEENSDHRHDHKKEDLGKKSIQEVE